jgi:hypothetical protein
MGGKSELSCHLNEWKKDASGYPEGYETLLFFSKSDKSAPSHGESLFAHRFIETIPVINIFL